MHTRTCESLKFEPSLTPHLRRRLREAKSPERDDEHVRDAIEEAMGRVVQLESQVERRF